MGGRWYDAWLGRFVQPDSLVPEPGNPQALNRYAWVLNNPLKFVDPSGHQGVPPWFYNVYTWFAMQLGYPDTSQLGVPALDGLTADVGKAWSKGLGATGQVMGTVADTGLSLMPGGGTAYDAYTAATGQNVVGETKSPSERALAGAFAVAGVVPVARSASEGATLLRRFTRESSLAKAWTQSKRQPVNMMQSGIKRGVKISNLKALISTRACQETNVGFVKKSKRDTKYLTLE
jgi:hypothetical protein